MEFALRLKELRESRGLTQSELARSLDVGVSTVGMWESTKRMPTAKMLSKLIDLFDCPIDYLLGFSDIAKIKNTEVYTTEEQQLIEKYRRLNPACKKLINNTIDTLVTTSATATEQKRTNL